MEQNPFGKAKVQRRPWSSLPDDILHNILSSLKLPRNIVITISATTLDIELCELSSFSLDGIYGFWNVLNNIVIIFTTTSIETFRVYLPWQYYLYSFDCLSRSIIDSWARHLGRNNVQHFTVTSYGDNIFDATPWVHAPSIFQMHSLVSLDLDLGVFTRDHSVPHSFNFPNMKKLVLVLVDNYEFLERILTSCPSLEDLSFTVQGFHYCNKQHTYYLRKDGSISVFSKSLRRLCISLPYKSGNLKVIIDTPNLLHLNFAAPNLPMSSEIFTAMFDSISHVKSVFVDIKAWTRIDDPTKTIFPNATHLTWASSSSHKYEDVALMLQFCPNLEVLVLEQKNNGNYWISLIAEDILMPLNHVKQIELHTNFVPLDQQFVSLATCLLRSSPFLEKLILNAAAFTSGAKADFFQPLLESSRLSPHCHIEFLGAYESLFPQK